MDLVGSTPPGSMKTVQQIIDELSAFPPDAKAAAYVAEDCGLVVYKPSHGKERAAYWRQAFGNPM